MKILVRIMVIVLFQAFVLARRAGKGMAVPSRFVPKIATMEVFVLPRIPANVCSGIMAGEMEEQKVAFRSFKTLLAILK